MKEHNEPCCNVLACCKYASRKAEGALVALLDAKGRQVDQTVTDADGLACLKVHRAGEYIMRATSRHPYVPRSIYIHVCLEPNALFSFVFRFYNPPVHKGRGTIRIFLEDVFYKHLPLMGGEYQLWQP
jgi:hypothetical protein